MPAARNRACRHRDRTPSRNPGHPPCRSGPSSARGTRRPLPPTALARRGSGALLDRNRAGSPSRDGGRQAGPAGGGLSAGQAEAPGHDRKPTPAAQPPRVACRSAPATGPQRPSHPATDISPAVAPAPAQFLDHVTYSALPDTGDHVTADLSPDSADRRGRPCHTRMNDLRAHADGAIAVVAARRTVTAGTVHRMAWRPGPLPGTDGDRPRSAARPCLSEAARDHVPGRHRSGGPVP